MFLLHKYFSFHPVLHFSTAHSNGTNKVIDTQCICCYSPSCIPKLTLACSSLFPPWSPPARLPCLPPPCRGASTALFRFCREVSAPAANGRFPTIFHFSSPIFHPPPPPLQ